MATLHYTDEGMLWECAEGIYAGHDQRTTSGRLKPMWQSLMSQDGSGLSRMFAVNRLARSHYDVWYDFICSYSERDLYYVHDKLPAIAGVATKFAQRFELTHNTYLAGSWEEDFLTGLLWRRHNRFTTLPP